VTFGVVKGVIEKTASAWALLGGIVLLAIVLVTTVNVGAFALDKLARVFGATLSGLPGYEDFVRLAVGCAALMFFPYCQLRRGNIAVDLFTKLVPDRARNVLDRCWTLVIAAVAGFLAFWMVLGMFETRADHALSPVLGWPVWPFYVPGIVSLVLWASVAVIQTFGTPAGTPADD
jgi:TRAP-type C4-dicarboxylate transport system permease small subunit